MYSLLHSSSSLSSFSWLSRRRRFVLFIFFISRSSFSDRAGNTQLFIPHDVGSLRIGRTKPEDKRTNAGFERCGESYVSRHQRGSLNSGWVWSNTSVKDLKGKVVLCRRKRRREKDREKEPEGEIVRERGRNGGRGEDGGREGSESTTEACVTSASEISCYRLSSVRLPHLLTPSPLPSDHRPYRRQSSPCVSHLQFMRTR